MTCTVMGRTGLAVYHSGLGQPVEGCRTLFHGDFDHGLFVPDRMTLKVHLDRIPPLMWKSVKLPA